MQIIFKLKKANTNFGDSISVVGNVYGIGSWNLDNSAKMNY